MDEWLATGDQAFLTKADSRLREIAQQSKVLVLASHQGDLLRQVCNRALVLDGGRIVFDGAVDEALAVHGAMQAA